MTKIQGVSKAQIREALAAGPDAARYDFDGCGFRYIDGGSGSDWLTRKPDAEPLWAIAPEVISNLLNQLDGKDAEIERLKAGRCQLHSAVAELKFALFSTDMTIKDRADQAARLALAAASEGSSDGD